MTEAEETIGGESSLENLPEIEDEENGSEHEQQEPEQTLEEQLIELLQNILQKSSPIAIKAMKDLEQMMVQGENTQELVDCANQLVEKIRTECDGNLNMNAPTQNHLINFLLLRFEEDRANLKKAAICALQAVFIQLHSPAIVNVCAERLALKCRDLAVAVRKQSALTLTRLLQAAPEYEKLRTTWLHAVMHLIVDREPSVQQFAAKWIAEVLIEPIAHDSGGLVWTLLAAIEEEADLRRLLLRTLVHLHKERSLPQKLVKTLLSRATKQPELANPCWMLLSELSAFFDVSPVSAIEYWADHLDLQQPNRLIGYMAKLIANRAEHLSLQQRNFLKGNVTEALMNHRVHASYIGHVYHLLARVLKGVGSENIQGHQSLQHFNQRWYGQSLREMDRLVYVQNGEKNSMLLQLEAEIKAARGDSAMEEDQNLEDDAEEYNSVNNMAIFRSPANSHAGNQQNEIAMAELPGTLNENCEKLIRLITSIGECIQYTPALISKLLFRLLQVIIAADVLKKVHQEHIDQGTTCAATPAFSRVFSPNTSFNTELHGIAGSSIAPTLVGASPMRQGMRTGAESVFSCQIRVKKRILRSELMNRKVRANAVLTLGKLCLQDEQLAKKCIPVFARELKQNDDHYIRNNIVVVVCDLCIRYTSMVDRYSAILASCLRDTSLLIRRQALMLLTNLIKEQYLKWEGHLIYRFVTTLLDEDPCIQEYANFCLTDILLPQFKERMFFHHFLECVFMFNEVRHPTRFAMNDESSNSNVGIECSLEGRSKFAQRMQLYEYMLNTFEDQQKVSVMEKIGLEIFVPIVEGGMRLNDVKVRNLLFDSFKIMTCPEIKLKMHLGKHDVDYEGDDEEPPELVKTAAKKFISSTFRRTIAETLMPNLFSMNAYLAEKQSPLAKICYSVILDLCSDHEEQLDDFLASDPRLKAEIRYDLKQRQPVPRRARPNTAMDRSNTTPARKGKSSSRAATVAPSQSRQMEE